MRQGAVLWVPNSMVKAPEAGQDLGPKYLAQGACYLESSVESGPDSRCFVIGMPTDDSVKTSQIENEVIERLETWLKSPQGTEQMKKAFEDSDKLTARIQREAAQNLEPDVLSRSRHK